MKIIVMSLVAVFSLASCTTTQQGQVIGGMVGAGTGYLLCKDKKDSEKAACMAAGAIVGAVVGGKIAEYLTEQDQQNITQTLDDTESTEPVAWCSDSKRTSYSVDDIECGDTNKIVSIPGPVRENNAGLVCRPIKTEVVMPDGNVETDSQTVCKGQDGSWHAQA